MDIDFTMKQEVELFDAARRLNDETSRRAFLEQACGENRALRERVEKLLAVEAEAEKFFQGTDHFIPAED